MPRKVAPQTGFRQMRKVRDRSGCLLVELRFTREAQQSGHRRRGVLFRVDLEVLVMVGTPWILDVPSFPWTAEERYAADL